MTRGPSRNRLALLLSLAVATWLAGRVWMFGALDWGYGHTLFVAGDVDRYAGWADLLAHGGYPHDDVTWQYPPGAALVMVAPRVLQGPLGYRRAFTLEMLLCDAAVLLTLCLVARRTRRTTGLWVWSLGGTALGPFLIHRFDLAPTALAVAGLVLAVRRPAVAGFVLALGGAVKVWPAVLIPTAAGGVRWLVRPLAGAVAAGVLTVAALLLTGRLGQSLGFVTEQKNRGLEFESVAATPYVLTRAFGHGGRPVLYQFGSFELVGGSVPTVVRLCTYLSAAALLVTVGAGLWLRPRGLADTTSVALVGILLLLLSSRVLSDQYLIWPLGLAAAGLCARERRSWRRWVRIACAAVLVVACAVTQDLFPLHFDGLLDSTKEAAVLLTVRNALLLLSLLLALAGLPRRGPALGGPVPGPASSGAEIAP